MIRQRVYGLALGYEDLNDHRTLRQNRVKSVDNRLTWGIRTEYLKASMRANVEHPFRIIKCQLGFVKARYRGLMKNDGKLAMLFALANAVRVDQMLRARG